MRTKQQKAEQLEALNELFEKATTVILTRYTGISAAKLTELRRRFNEAGAKYQVVKNTLARRAVQGGKMEFLSEYFKGPIALAVGFDDPSAPAKVLTKAEKDADFKKLEAVVGALEGTKIEPEGLESLAKMPGKLELRAQLLGTMNAVPSKFVRTLNEVPEGFARLLGNVNGGFVRVLAARKAQLEE